MGDISRPDRPIPTTARRVPPPPPVQQPSVVVVPGVAPLSPPPVVSHQTVVIIQTPPTPVVEKKQPYEFAPVRRKPARRTGFLAVMSMLIGVAGAAAAFRAEIVGYAPAIAATGFFAAFIALFRSTFTTRTTFRAPMIGMLIGFAAYTFAIARNHKLQAQYDQARGWSGNRLPDLALARFESTAEKITQQVPPAPAKPGEPTVPIKPDVPAPAGTTASPPAVPVKGASPPSSTPEKSDSNRKSRSFLDPNSGGWVTPGEKPPATKDK